MRTKMFKEHHVPIAIVIAQTKSPRTTQSYHLTVLEVTGLIGLQSTCWQGCSFWRLKGESVSLSVPASEAACTSLLVVPSSIFTASQPVTLTSAFMVTSLSCTLCLPLPSFKDSGITHWAHIENPEKLPYFKILYLITRAMSSNIFTGYSK